MAVGASDMTQHITPHRFAGAAIAAVLALGSTPLWAQDIAPVAAPPAPVAPQPTIVLPDVTVAPAEPVVAAPIREPVIAAPATERAAPRAAAAVSRTTPSRVVPAPVVRSQVAPVDPVAATQAEAPVAITPVDPMTTAETPIEEPLVEETAAVPADNTTGDVLPLAGLLAALGLGGLALFVARRRRKPDEVAEVIVAHEPIPVLPPRAAALKPVLTPAPAFMAPAMSLQQFAQPATQDATGTVGQQIARPAWQEPRRAAAAPNLGQSSQLNREALLTRMVAAEPDANNPFTSGKARRRRARLMLQSMDNHRWDDADLAEGFDWREQARATRQLETV